MQSKHARKSGFTLIETIIYIALFGILFTGIFISVYPLFTSAERLSENILAEGETAFILSKIRYALSDSIIAPYGVITTPEKPPLAEESTTANELVLTVGGAQRYHFRQGPQDTPCRSGGPALCSAIELKVENDEFMSLSSRRLNVTDFLVTHVGPRGNAPRYLDISFSVNGRPVEPVRYYVRF